MPNRLNVELVSISSNILELCHMLLLQTDLCVCVYVYASVTISVHFPSCPSQHVTNMLTGCCNECALVGFEFLLHQIRKSAVGLKLDVPSDNGSVQCPLELSSIRRTKVMQKKSRLETMGTMTCTELHEGST